MFDPKTDKYPYPEDTASHYLDVKMDRGIVTCNKYQIAALFVKITLDENFICIRMCEPTN